MTLEAVRDFIARIRRRRARVAVVGDGIRDEWVEGELARISPESPCPVLLERAVVRRPGGAANVAEQLRHWNVEVRLFAPGPEAWPVKRRLVAGGHTLLRHDAGEPPRPMPGAEREAFIAGVLDHVRHGRPDVLVLSDYAKGTLDRDTIHAVVRECRHWSIPTVADHKRRPLHEWAGVGVLKMNEAEAARGDLPALLQACRHLAEPAVVVTRGAEPPRLPLTGNGVAGPPLSVPVQSVCGAGDCFTAFLALGLAHARPVPEAAALAHLAGGSYVGRPYNSPPLPCEVLGVIDPAGAKILAVAELREVLDARHAGQRVVVCPGCFDLLHAGHLATLGWARRQGDCLVAAVNDDASVARLKGAGRPVLPLAQRQALLAALSCVNYVVSFGEDSPAALLEALAGSVQAVVKGADWAARLAGSPEARLVPEVLAAPADPEATLHSSDLLRRARG
jgi:D-beta-D-heptose 7-phosphate kinase/D-beta-D-heptose 1-phosphate adenosyltransferase